MGKWIFVVIVKSHTAPQYLHFNFIMQVHGLWLSSWLAYTLTTGGTDFSLRISPHFKG